MEWRRWKIECRRRLADQDGNGRFELRSFDGNISVLDHGGLQLSSGLRNIGFRSSAAFKPVGGELQGILESLHRVVQKLLLSVRAAQLEVVECQFRAKAKTDRFQIGGRRLRLFPGSGNRPPHSSPDIEFVREIEGKHKVSGAARGGEVRSVGRVAYGGNTRRGGDRRKLRRAVEAHRRPRLLKAGVRDVEVLVGDGELSFECVQLLVPEDFPPCPSPGLVAWVGCFPAIHFFKRIHGRSWYAGPRVLGTHRATGQQHRYYCCDNSARAPPHSPAPPDRALPT